MSSSTYFMLGPAGGANNFSPQNSVPFLGYPLLSSTANVSVPNDLQDFFNFNTVSGPVLTPTAKIAQIDVSSVNYQTTLFNQASYAPGAVISLGITWMDTATGDILSPGFLLGPSPDVTSFPWNGYASTNSFYLAEGDYLVGVEGVSATCLLYETPPTGGAFGGGDGIYRIRLTGLYGGSLAVGSGEVLADALFTPTYNPPPSAKYPFRFMAAPGFHIVGFFGWSDYLLDAVGVICAPLPPAVVDPRLNGFVAPTLRLSA